MLHKGNIHVYAVAVAVWLVQSEHERAVAVALAERTAVPDNDLTQSEPATIGRMI